MDYTKKNMLIGLISDTHVARPHEKLPPQVKTAFKDVDLILHAGDIWTPPVLDELEAVAPVMCAWGDDDLEEDLGNDPRIVTDRILYMGGITIWLVHEKPAYGFIVPKENRIFSRIPKIAHEIPDVVVYGHTHKALIENHEGVLIVNPGSPNWPNHFPALRTVALLNIEWGKATARIVHLREQ